MLRPYCLAVLAALIFACSVWPHDTSATIVNTLRGFSDTEPGWSGEVAGGYGASGGNTQETTFHGEAQVQWRHKKETVRLIGSAKRTSTYGIETARALMGHLRYNHWFSRRWSSLVFLQAQENPFQRLKSRTLLGLGARYELLREDNFHLALGASAMMDRERLEGEDQHTSELRLSMFVSAVYDIREGISLDGLVFYQPACADFSDWRLFGTIALDIDLVGSLVLFTGAEVEHNSQPPELVEATDWSTSTGFKVGF